MAIRMGQFGPTTKISVTSTSSVTPFTPGSSDVSKHRYLLTADATVYIERNGVASTSSAILFTNQQYEIELLGSDTLAAITASTANLYVTLLG